MRSVAEGFVLRLTIAAEGESVARFVLLANLPSIWISLIIGSFDLFGHRGFSGDYVTAILCDFDPFSALVQVFYPL